MDKDKHMDDFLGKATLNLEKFKPTSEFRESSLKVENNLVKKDAFVYLKVKYDA